MRRVEQHVIEKSHPQYRAIDEMAFASENLWNLAHDHVRQSFIFQKAYLNNTATFHLLTETDAYKARPSTVATHILVQLHHAWTAFFEAMEVYREHPERFQAQPGLPTYVHTTRGRTLLIFEAEHQHADGLNPDVFVALDPGVSVLAALTSNKPGFVPRLVAGKPVKAVNQLYTKQREHAQKQLATGRDPRFSSHRLDRITTQRNRRVMHSLHTANRRIVDLLVAEGSGTLVLGKNPFWKTRVELAKKHNQEFVNIPHAIFLELLTYKAETLGMRVFVTEESYTSKASFLDLDPLPTYDPRQGAEQEERPRFSGERVGRWYRVKGRTPLHSDINGSFTIGRKVFPTAFGPGIAATAVRPRRLAV